MNTIIDDLKWRYAVKKFDSNKILSNEKIGDLTYFVNPGKDPND